MNSTRRFALVSLLVSAAYVGVVACGDDEAAPVGDGTDGAADTSVTDTSIDTSAVDGRSPEYTGSACAVASECYGDLPDAAALKGAPVCIDKVSGGYCTHKCQADTDCCAIPGECRTGLKQVCAPFENTGDKYCFLSCEGADISAASDAGASDAGAGAGGDDYCHANATSEFGCRSTGGGSANRKVCLPNGAPGDGGRDAAKDAIDDAPTDG
jgi:hypothetical protein